jgi:hypothetical protein
VYTNITLYDSAQLTIIRCIRFSLQGICCPVVRRPVMPKHVELYKEKGRGHVQMRVPMYGRSCTKMASNENRKSEYAVQQDITV